MRPVASQLQLSLPFRGEVIKSFFFILSLSIFTNAHAETPKVAPQGTHGPATPAQAPATAPKAATPADDKPWKSITLRDSWGDRRSLNSLLQQKPKAIVVVTMNTKCFLMKKYLPEILRLEKEYRARGIQVVGINASNGDKVEDVLGHGFDNEIPFPILKDPKQHLVDALKIAHTPEFMVLDPELNIRYQGAIDDQYSTTTHQSAPQNRYLRNALDEILAEKKVSVPKTESDGCPIARSEKEPLKVDYAKDVAPILQNKCMVCHRDGQVAGDYAMGTYDEAVALAPMMHTMVDSGRMPPWHADKKHYHFGPIANDRSLTTKEREILTSWSSQAKPARGDEKLLPAPKKWAEGWQLGEPDKIITIGTKFKVPAEGEVEYQYFTVPTLFDEDVWIRAAEVQPGAAGVVHHAIVHVTAGTKQETDYLSFAKRVPQVVAAYETIPKEKRPPFMEFAAKLAKINDLYDPDKAAVLGSFVPGQSVNQLPPGTAIKVAKGSTVTFEMHYTPNGTEQTDETRVGIYLAKEKPKQEIKTDPFGKIPLKIPAGEPFHKESNEHLFKADSQIISLQPHAHKRARSWKYELIFPDGKTQTVLSVPKFDFNWQTTYEFKTPVKVPAGTKLRATAVWDNSKLNPRNPTREKPTQVPWGFQTDEEMMNGWLTYVVDEKK